MAGAQRRTSGGWKSATQWRGAERFQSPVNLFLSYTLSNRFTTHARREASAPSTSFASAAGFTGADPAPAGAVTEETPTAASEG